MGNIFNVSDKSEQYYLVSYLQYLLFLAILYMHWNIRIHLDQLMPVMLTGIVDSSMYIVGRCGK